MLHYFCHTLHKPNYKVQSKTSVVHSSVGPTYSSQQLISQGFINPTLNKPMNAQPRRSTQTISGVLIEKKKKYVKILYKILFCKQALWHLLWTINLYLLIIHVAIAITKWISCMTCHCSGLKHFWSCFSHKQTASIFRLLLHILSLKSRIKNFWRLSVQARKTWTGNDTEELKLTSGHRKHMNSSPCAPPPTITHTHKLNQSELTIRPGPRPCTLTRTILYPCCKAFCNEQTNFALN